MLMFSGSLITGLPTAFPTDDEKITTPFPYPLEYYIDGRALHMEHKTISSMRQCPPDLYDPEDPFDNMQCFFVKCLHLLSRAASLALRAKDGTEDVVDEIFITGQSLSRLGESLSRYREKNGLYSGITAHDGVLVLAITATHAAWIQLLNISAEQDSVSWARRLEIARASMAIVREAIAADPACLHLLLGLTWTPVYEVLAWELFKCKENADEEGAALVQLELNQLLGALKVLARVFPFKMDMHVEHLKRFRIHSMDLRV